MYAFHFQLGIKEDSQSVNLCKRDTMSQCVGITYNEQTKCRFYQKATLNDRCMWKVFGSFCGCIDAQIDAEKSLEERNQEVIEEMKDSEVGRSF